MPDEKLKPGESRVLYVKPCPPEMYSRPNGYYAVRRAAMHLIINNLDYLWEKGMLGSGIIDAFETMRGLTCHFPSKPMRCWEEERRGDVTEICCPTCETVFQWEGYFYAPQCPGCKRWLQSRKEKEEANESMERGIKVEQGTGDSL